MGSTCETVVSGVLSQDRKSCRAVVYAHHMLDTESRSEAEFDVTLDLTGLPKGPLVVREYRFDKDNNSYFRLGRKVREQRPPSGATTVPAAAARDVEKLARLRATRVTWPRADNGGRLSLTVRVAANGANFLVIKPPTPLHLPF